MREGGREGGKLYTLLRSPVRRALAYQPSPLKAFQSPGYLAWGWGGVAGIRLLWTKPHLFPSLEGLPAVKLTVMDGEQYSMLFSTQSMSGPKRVKVTCQLSLLI